MTDPSRKLGVTEVFEAAVPDFSLILGTLRVHYETGNFAAGLHLVNLIGEAAEEADHHPEISLAYGSVEVRLWSHDAGGVTSRDLDLARTIAQTAASLGHESRPEEIAVVELGLDSDQAQRLAPAYAALLGTQVVNDEAFDPTGRKPCVWFQDREDEYVAQPGEPDQRWHLDVWVAPGLGKARVDEFVAAGGRLLDDSEAPSFWVVADAEGNRSCVCTVGGRG